MSSGRIKGLVNTMYAKKRKLLQRPPLTVVQIIHLEDIVLNSHKTEYDRVAAGFFLFVLMGRLRFSDGQRWPADLPATAGSTTGWFWVCGGSCSQNQDVSVFGEEDAAFTGSCAIDPIWRSTVVAGLAGN